MHLVLFTLFAGLCIAGALNLLLQKHPINSALSLVVVMSSLAVLYLLLGAEFLAAAQIIVYAGAIMVLFIFVIMLLNAGGESGRGRSLTAQILGVPALIAFLGAIVFSIRRLFPTGTNVSFGAFTGGTAEKFGHSLFFQYLLPFEVTSILILIAILGAIVLARKELD
jgi:NADH-quinone oxidoreductase subunit J